MKHTKFNLAKQSILTIFFLAFVLLANAQTRRITGTVVDERSEPIIGASVIVEGTSIGAITDFDGKFSLDLAEGQKFKVSFIGYITQVVNPKSSVIEIILQEDAQTLDEFVVIGYGEQRLRNVTGSVTTISAEDLEDIPVATLAEALQGQIVGLEVELGSPRPGDNNTEVYVRQSRTLNGISKDGGNLTPLIIIDDVMQLGDNGAPTMEQFNMLNPTEVESITVLRDASAAIYGSRAANGAILVKTKRGRSGAPKISYSGKFAVNDAISHTKVLRGSDYGRFHNAFALGANKVADRTEVDKLFSDVELAEMDLLNYDWLEKADWKPALTQTHSLNVSGGSEKATYYAGLTLYDQGDNLGGQDYRKYTYRAGVDISLSNDIKLSATISGNEQKKKQIYTKGARFSLYGGGSSTKSDYNALHHMPNHLPWSVSLLNDNGMEQDYWLGPMTNLYNNPRYNRDTATSWNYFALRDSGSYSNSDSDSWNANISMTYAAPFLKGLSVRASFSSSHSNSVGEQASFPYQIAYISSRMGADQHLAYSIPDNNFKKAIFSSDSQLAFRYARSESKQMNFYANYDNTFGDHSVSAIFSVERREASNSGSSMIFADLAYDISDTYLGVGGPSIVKPGGSSALQSDNTVTTRAESGSLSYLGRVSYSYADRYMLQFLFRSDASTKFAPENYWGFFPSISAGWVVSDEPWYKESVSWMPFLKVYASWGRTGRDNIKAWKWKEQYRMELKGLQFGQQGGLYGTSLTPGPSPNRNVRWDRSDKFNLGFNMRFFNGRLSPTLEFYYDINDDILNQFMKDQLGVPIYAGGSYAEENFGRVDTYGAELSLTWRDKIGKVNYNIGANFGLYDNKVKKWVADLRYNQYPNSLNWAEGMSTIMPAWGYKVWRGTSTGDGILRTQDDIDAYWAYLEGNAQRYNETYPNDVQMEARYLSVKSKDGMKLGMLAYQDLGGEMKENTQKIANGQIVESQDYGKLVDKNKTYSLNTKFGFSWESLSVNVNMNTSWGGINFLDRNTIGAGDKDMLWAPDAFWSDMYDPTTNPGGKYPNLGVNSDISGSVTAPSDFWKISSFRCYIRSVTLAYSLPRKWVTPLSLDAVRFNITGNNLWDLYNPYPNNYRNMYNGSAVDYPTLRTWSFGVNVSF